MNKYDIYNIIKTKKIILFKEYAEAESVLDKRMTIQNDGVSYSGMDFIKYIPDETDRTEKSKKYGYFWSDMEIVYFGESNYGLDSFGLDNFIYKREARSELGKHVKSVFKVLNAIESDVNDFNTKSNKKSA